MNFPIIGRTWNVVPERTTLTEARKLIDGRDVYLRAAMAKAGNTLLNALKTLGGSNV